MNDELKGWATLQVMREGPTKAIGLQVLDVLGANEQLADALREQGERYDELAVKCEDLQRRQADDARVQMTLLAERNVGNMSGWLG